MSREAFVKAFQENLATRFPHGYQGWWHRFIFHFSDISNVTSILSSGKLYSRNKAVLLGVMQNDNASDEVIGNTGLNAKDFVRFYFGTGTPTQFHNEGFKPRSKIQNNAHCPLPIFLLFDFVRLLSHQDSHFSSGNIAADGADIYTDITALDSLEFEYIYHRGYIQEPLNTRHVVYCRHAEVLIPDALDIYDYLAYVCVRSEAEKETLLYSLPSETGESLKDKLRVRTNGLFEPRRLYVESVKFVNERIEIIFSMATTDKYVMKTTVINLDTGVKRERETGLISLESKQVSIQLDPQYIGDNIEFRLEIDGHLAYANVFVNDNNLVF